MNSIKKSSEPHRKISQLEVWTKDADQQCSLTEFYNASDILGKESFQAKNQSLEAVLNFLKERRILEVDDKIVSLQDAIDAVKKYAESKNQCS